MKKVLTILVSLCLVVAAVGVTIYFVNKPKDANAIMECSVNPALQLVLDSNNKVMAVNCKNEDAEILSAKVNFKGKTADEAARLFVEASTELGYIKVDTVGTKVDVTIYADASFDTAELNKKIETKVNGYFDQMGMIAGVVAKKSEDIASQLKAFGTSAEEIATKTTEELLNLYKENAEEFEGIALAKKAEFETALNSALKDAEILAKKALNVAKEALTQAEGKIDELNKKISNSNLPEEAKEAAKKLLAETKNQVKELKKEVKELEKKYDKAKKEFKAELEAKAKELRKASETALNEAKTMFEEKVEATKALINKHQKASQAAIDAYRAELNK